MIQDPKTSQETIANVVNSSSHESLADYLEDYDYDENSDLLSQVKSVNIENEKLEFYKIIEEKGFEASSTKSLWIANKSKLLYMYALALILLNIPSSAAYIECFYSLC